MHDPISFERKQIAAVYSLQTLSEGWKLQFHTQRLLQFVIPDALFAATPASGKGGYTRRRVHSLNRTTS